MKSTRSYYDKKCSLNEFPFVFRSFFIDSMPAGADIEIKKEFTRSLSYYIQKNRRHRTV